MARKWTDVLTEHSITIAAVGASGPLMDEIAGALSACLRSGNKILLCGNGGSAADALHVAGELLGRFRAERRSLSAIALSADVCTLTAVSNDYGFERVFARQVEGLGRPSDILWALSTSGKSPNVLAALDAARSLSMKTIGFTGQSGGDMPPRCDWLFRAPHTSSDRIQECHQLAYHYLCERVEAAFVQIDEESQMTNHE